MYPVQKLPIPTPPPRHRKSKYPFKETPVGMSFVVPAGEAPHIETMRSRIWKVNRRLRTNFKVHRLENGALQITHHEHNA